MKWFIQLLIAMLAGSCVYGQGLTKIQYFFDSDLGVGNGPTVTLTIPIDSTIGSASLSTTSLGPGFHTVNYRVMDSAGTWSLYQKRSFYIQDTMQTGTPEQISRIEYFFDGDPGAGNGPGAVFTSPVDTLDGGASLVTTSLGPGFHTISYRIKNTQEVYSLYQKRTLYIQDTSQVGADPLVETAFSIDGGPGVSNTSIATGHNNLDSVDQNLSLGFTNLQPGFHQLAVWSIDDDYFEPGLYQNRTFFVSDSNEVGPAPKLNALEYFVDTDPGIGNAIRIPFTPVDSIDTLLVIAQPSGLAIGWHYLGMRARDERGLWSQTRVDSFQVLSGCTFNASITVNGSPEICAGDSVQLSAGTFLGTYTWSTGDTTSSIWVSTSGSYSCSIVDQAGCLGRTDTVVINQLPSPQPVVVSDSGNAEICVGDTLVLYILSTHDAYVWSTGDTLPSVMITQAGNYSVTVTDGGCQGASEPFSVFTYQPPTPDVIQIGTDSLQSSITGSSYVWYFNATVLPFTTQTIVATQSGVYQVQIIDETDCASDKSEFYEFVLTDIDKLVGIGWLEVYPNPMADRLILEWEMFQAGAWEIRMLDARGRILISEKEDWATGVIRREWEVAELPQGLYYLQLDSREGRFGTSLRKN